MKKLYLAIIRDHSGSMTNLANVAMADYNNLIEQYKKESDDELAIIMSSFIVSSAVKTENVLMPIEKVKPLKHYVAIGMTALFDAIGNAITSMESLPDAKDPNVQFLVMVLTDGGENGSMRWGGYNLGEKIRETQNLGNWTFSFRVPYDVSKVIHSLGVPQENIHVWDGQSEESYQASSIRTSASVSNYTTSVRSGIRSTDKFYTDLSNVSADDIKKKMLDISSKVKVFLTTKPEVIKPYIEQMTGHYTKGTVYYQLTKKEDVVQDYKYILINDKSTGAVYGGNEARELLGLPIVGNCKIVPGNHGNFEIFIQSTSINRKLPAGTKVVVYDPMKVAPVVSPTFASPTAQPKPVAASGYVAPEAVKTDYYTLGFKDGRARRKQKFKNDTQYMKGYRDGRTDR